ncbi:MAG: DUF6113 family protein [Georgenia sp.]
MSPVLDADRAGRAASAAVVVVIGGLVAASATLVHRSEVAGLPVGLVAAFATVLVGAVLARAVGDGVGVFLYGLAALLTVLLMTYYVPGGDVILTSGPVSYAWLLGTSVATAAVALTPRSWYADAPVPRDA